MSDMELLAPAGDWEALKVAVAAGADAVYLGGKLFGARQGAVNFSDDDLAKAADYLHLRGRKLYVTVNTLIKDDEFEEALLFLNHLYQIGADAVIIQDLGLLRLTRKIWPDLHLHASTQMTVTDAAGVQLLKDLGIKRVVIAREISLQETIEIIQKTGMEIEIFLHGALCISYSGACLFSSMIGGRSGNRGRCAQPCRLPYQLLQAGKEVDLNGARLLSPRDLALLPNLPELAAAGVKALKIEGRMKGPEYVGIVVKTYRAALDRLLKDPKAFEPLPEEERALASVFNRGFTSGYQKEDLGPAEMSINQSSNRGFFIGRVTSYDQKSHRVKVLLEKELCVKDGIMVWVTRGGRRGAIVEDLRVGNEKVETAFAGEEASFSISDPVYPGDRVFLTSSRWVEEETRQMLRNDFIFARLPIRMKASVAPDQPLTITLDDLEGNLVTILSKEVAHTAIKHPLTPAILEEHLTRLGDTSFVVESFSAKVSGEPMLPYGLIHKVRREAVTALARKRLGLYHRKPLLPALIRRQIEREEGPPRTGRNRLAVFAGNISIVHEAALAGVNKIIFGGESFRQGVKWDEKSLGQAVEISRKAGVQTIIALPSLWRQRESKIIRRYLEMVRYLSPDGLLISSIGGLRFARKETDLPLYVNYPLYSFNRYTGSFFVEMGIKGITLSPELSRPELFRFFHDFELSQIELEVLVFGAMELMISQFCPIGSWIGKERSGECGSPCLSSQYSLKDRKGIEFPISIDNFCHMHLLNSRDLSLIQEIPDLQEKDLSLRLDLRFHPNETARRIILLCQEGVATKCDHDLWEKVASVSGRGLTRGHYHRGVE